MNDPRDTLRTNPSELRRGAHAVVSFTLILLDETSRATKIGPDAGDIVRQRTGSAASKMADEEESAETG